MRTKKWEKYIFNWKNTLREKDFKYSFSNYEEALEQLLQCKNSKTIDRLKQTKEELKDCFLPEEWPRNILKISSVKDKKIGSGQDSVVFEFQTISKWIYKEWQKANTENLKYMIKKYKILRKYLWKLISDSYFVIWEAYEKFFKRWFKNWVFIQDKLITIQRKVKWKDLNKMDKKDKLDKKLLDKLEKAHRKYILLKIFIEQISNNLNVKDKLDVKLDLWPLSNIDKWNFNNDDFIFTNLTSPNIMFDWENIYFIDFWFWAWSQDKEKIYQELMKEETLKKWKEILENFSLN